MGRNTRATEVGDRGMTLAQSDNWDGLMLDRAMAVRVPRDETWR